MKDAGQTERSPGVRLPRVGLIATDGVRAMGLKSILGSGVVYDIVSLSAGPGREWAVGLELVLLDSAAVRNVAEVLAESRSRRPPVPVIVLGAANDLEHIERLIGAGAKGYLSYAAGEKELRSAIEVVRDGSVWAPRKVMSRLIESSQRRRPEGDGAPIQFTRRELEVMKLLVMGHPNRQIALALGVDEGTVKAHMGRLMRKAGVGNRTALSMKAIDREWT